MYDVQLKICSLQYLGGHATAIAVKTAPGLNGSYTIVYFGGKNGDFGKV